MEDCVGDGNREPKEGRKELRSSWVWLTELALSDLRCSHLLRLRLLRRSSSSSLTFSIAPLAPIAHLAFLSCPCRGLFPLLLLAAAAAAFLASQEGIEEKIGVACRLVCEVKASQSRVLETKSFAQQVLVVWCGLTHT